MTKGGPPNGGPLAGVRVIELSHIMAGPCCGMMLGDMGADVIKVERPTGDDTRRTVPPEINGESAAFMTMNRNKRGVCLNLKEPGAVDALRRLIRDLRGMPGPRLLMGDLNLPPAPAARWSRMRALAAAATFPAEAPDRQLDHILTDHPGLRGRGCLTPDAPLSDHRPLLVEVDDPGAG